MKKMENERIALLKEILVELSLAEKVAKELNFEYSVKLRTAKKKMSESIEALEDLQNYGRLLSGMQ